jgi:putative membrane protein
MMTAFVLSSVFLISYVTYHTFTEPTRFGGEGILKVIYYFILITHIILATAVLPMVLFSLTYGLQSRFDKHRRVAKWTFPIWLYVAISGVLVYLLISPYYVYA